VTTDANGVSHYQGQQVVCTPGLHCIRYEASPVDHVVHGTEDVSLTAWGLGLQGLSATVLLEGRADLAGDFTWPRSNDPFDAVLAYAQLVRGRLRIRLGRQDARSQLGFSSFDGGDVRWSPIPRVRLEAYGGRSLARALREPRDEALKGLQRYVPDQDAYLFGGAVEAEPVRGTELSARYQRDIWANHAALLSERATVAVRSVTMAPLRIDASGDYDFAFGRVGKAHLTLQIPIAPLSVEVDATARRYLPYFELYTIWGFFSPVAYHEAELSGKWWPTRTLQFSVSGARRWYGETPTSNFLPILEPLQGTAWRSSADVRWTPTSSLWVSGRYHLEWANGGFLSSGNLSARWQVDPRLSVSVNGTALQQLEEFRFGQSTAVGVGGSGRFQITSRLELGAGVSVYRRLSSDHRYQANLDWSQLRGWSSLQVAIGGDPGLREGEP